MNPQPDDLIEAALESYPLAELPPNFSKRVMQQVRAIPGSARFRLTWMDYALGLLTTLLPAVGFALWVFLPRQVLVDTEFQWRVFQASSLQPVITGSLALAGVLLLSVVLLCVGLLLRPRVGG